MRPKQHFLVTVLFEKVCNRMKGNNLMPRTDWLYH